MASGPATESDIDGHIQMRAAVIALACTTYHSSDHSTAGCAGSLH